MWPVLRDQVGCVSNVTVDVLDAATGRRLRRERGHNLTPTGGRNLLIDCLAYDGIGIAPLGLTHIALGTGSTAPTNNDTALAAELLRDVVTGRTKNSLKLTLKYYLPANQGNGNTIREAGLFNAATLGTLYARYVLSNPVVKTSSIAVVFAWELSFTVTAVQILERGSVVELGGDGDDSTTATAYAAGATFDKLVPQSGVWFIDSADLQGGSFALEAVVRTNNASGQVTIGLFNLDDGAPDTPLTGSEISGTVGNQTGQRIRSAAITFPAAGAAKTLGVKVKSNNGSFAASAWSLRIVRVG